MSPKQLELWEQGKPNIEISAVVPPPSKLTKVRPRMGLNQLRILKAVSASKGTWAPASDIRKKVYKSDNNNARANMSRALTSLERQGYIKRADHWPHLNQPDKKLGRKYIKIKLTSSGKSYLRGKG